MTKENFDHQLKNSLMQGTEYPSHLKEEIWKKIEQQLSTETTIPNRQSRSSQRVKKKSFWRKKGTVVGLAAILLLAFTIGITDTGNALISQVKQLFVPEKTVIDEIEGTEEENQVSLEEGRSGYVIYFDKERYKMIEVNGKDRIVLTEPLDDRYPDVYMEIDQVEKQPEMAAKEMYEQLQKGDYKKVYQVEQVVEPIAGYVTYAIGGTGGASWDDPIEKYYIFSNEKNGSFIVKQQYFLEASEGHGARFTQMLKEFYIVDVNE